MGNIIYYFSGRGNSLSVAQGLAERLEGAQIMPMAAEKGIIKVNGGLIGLVLPVIDFGLPLLVRKFINRLACTGDKPHVFAVITCGGMPGASMAELKKLLRKRGLELAAGQYIVFGLERMTDEDWRSRLDAIASTVGRREGAPLPKAKFIHRLMTGLANPLARLIIPGEDRKFKVDVGCNGCGVCRKVCPVGNIEIVSGKPVWLHHCEQCAACFSWCPEEAISGACLAARTHYRNPRVDLRAMLKSSVKA
jgi:ferredoxin